MAQILKREPIERKDIVRLSGLTELELTQTTRDNFNKLTDSRKNTLEEFDDLTEAEIKDIREFRLDVKTSKQFSNVDDLIADLND